jgi:hypothetical protein
MSGGSFKKWIKPWTEEARVLPYDIYNLSKKGIVSHILPRFASMTLKSIYQEEGIATTSFISVSLQRVDSEKITVEDEEALMHVAVHIYGGMLSSLQSS